MIKYIVIGLFLLVEVYGITILGYLYSIDNSSLNLILLIGACVITFLGSLLDISILKDNTKKQTKTKKECPYFIERDENDLHK